MTMKKRTLEEIIKEEREHRQEGGAFGIAECKLAVRFDYEIERKSYYELLEEYVKCANEDVFFNKAMVLACWEIINEKK